MSLPTSPSPDPATARSALAPCRPPSGRLSPPSSSRRPPRRTRISKARWCATFWSGHGRVARAVGELRVTRQGLAKLMVCLDINRVQSGPRPPRPRCPRGSPQRPGAGGALQKLRRLHPSWKEQSAGSDPARRGVTEERLSRRKTAGLPWSLPASRAANIGPPVPAKGRNRAGKRGALRREGSARGDVIRAVTGGHRPNHTLGRARSAWFGSRRCVRSGSHCSPGLGMR